jgi:hypothetical protein
MNTAFALTGTALLLSTPAASPTVPAEDWVIGAGEVVRYDTAGGPVTVDNFRIEAGATLRILGSAPFDLLAFESIQIDGTLDLSGFDSPDVLTLDQPQIPEVGAVGGPLGGRGGPASRRTTTVTPKGTDGFGPGARPHLGGEGGESGWHPSSASSGIYRRAAGGGGGVLGPDQPIIPDEPEHPSNLGLIALPGVDGNPQATSAIGFHLPWGGVIGSPVFVDGDPGNDFFGRKSTPSGGSITGELASPIAGQGGGGGGDAIWTNFYPPVVLIPSKNDKGGAAGGGGGLCILQAEEIGIGPVGRILADGGSGGAGENTAFFNRIGGGGGGGSGGMLLLQSRRIDLSMASSDALRCRGGAGGEGANNHLRAEGGGGHGGPGLIQLHVPAGDPAKVRLPSGVSLEDLSSPTAHILWLE